MVEGVTRNPLLLEPVHGPRVDGGQLLCQRFPCPFFDELGKEVMVPIPPPFIVERDQEEIVPFELREHVGAVRPLQHDIAEHGIKASEHRGPEQELRHRIGLTTQHLIDEVVEDVLMPSREGFDEGLGIVAALERQGDEVQGSVLWLCFWL